MQKYNLALIPEQKSEEVIQFAERFAGLQHQYLLGKNSLPHVTLYQFYCKENEIENISKEVAKRWHEPPIYLAFHGFSCLTFHNEVYWVSLMPNERDKLHKMHALIADIIKHPIKDNFDPHMTLLNCASKNEDAKIQTIFKSYQLIKDSFVLVLGKSDKVGQLTEILHQFD